jgi:hypothetical protein
MGQKYFHILEKMQHLLQYYFCKMEDANMAFASHPHYGRLIVVARSVHFGVEQ